MQKRTRAITALSGGALPASDQVRLAFPIVDWTMVYESPPCALFARDAAQRINAHCGYAVARNPRDNLRRRRELWHALLGRRAQCLPVIAFPRDLLISD